MAGGTRRARPKAAPGLIWQAAQYRETMLLSLREVNDALSAVSAADQQWANVSEDLGVSSIRAETLTRMAANGTASRAQTVEAQLDISQLRQKKLEQDYRRLAASIDLIKAIGGAWGSQSTQ